MSILNDPSGAAKQLRFSTYICIRELQKIEKTKDPKNLGLFYRSEISININKILSSMSDLEKDILNTSYLTSLRLDGVSLDQAVTYRLLGPAVRWKLKSEFDQCFYKP